MSESPKKPRDWLVDDAIGPNEEAEQERWWNEQAARLGPDLLSQKLGQRDRLSTLITTYADGDAQTEFDRLREWFWGGAIQDAVKAERARKTEAGQ